MELLIYLVIDLRDLKKCSPIEEKSSLINLNIKNINRTQIVGYVIVLMWRVKL